jgi:hypothetical protein
MGTQRIFKIKKGVESSGWILISERIIEKGSGKKKEIKTIFHCERNIEYF